MSTLTITEALARHGAIALASMSPSRALGGRLFVKEVASVGEWVHSESGDRVAFSREDIAEIAENTNRFIGVQGPIPFPDGHTFLSAKNLGYWPRVTDDGGRLLGIVEAGTPEIAAKLGTTIRGVSMYLEGKVRDSKGGEHKRVMTHIAATEYPVVTGQDNFIALSRDGTETRAPVYRPAEEGGKSMHKTITALAAALGVSIEGLDEEKAAAAIEAKAKEAAAAAAKAGEATALAAKKDAEIATAKSEVTALSGKVDQLQKSIEARELADCDREITSVKELAAKSGRPEAFDAAREKYVRERWLKDPEAARQTLALARELATAGAKLEGTAVIRPPDKEATALAKKDAIDTAKREAMAMGWNTREEKDATGKVVKLIAWKAGEKREHVLVG